MNGPTGVLLVNIGTPDAPRTPEVRKYLREFLSDPRVVDINPVGRWALLNLVILPFRPKVSAAAYRTIWGADGSPLLSYSNELRDAVGTRLGDNYSVEVGMRYGSPSIATGLRKLLADRVERLVVIPLFPQYASASNGSAAEEVMRLLAPAWNMPDLTITGAFYSHPKFIDAFAARIKETQREFNPDHILFSYHGLPERQVIRSEAAEMECERVGPCPAIGDGNRMCYRAQSYETTRLLAAKLELDASRYTTSFQSRLGRTPWIKPYTDHVLPELAKHGHKRLMVTVPSFVADCLETSEEIAIRAKEQWLALGGESFAMVPSLNAHPAWVEAVEALVRGQ